MKTSPLLFMICLIMQVSIFGINAQTTISAGDVAGTWTKANSPYQVQGDILIPDGQTLTIEAGTRIEFDPSKYLMVKGSIRAEGTANDNIIFTVSDTTGFWNTENTNGGWGGLRFIHFESEQDSSKLNSCTFEYGKAVSDMWNLDNGGAICVEHFDKMEISNCLFQNNLAGGPNFSQGGALAIQNSDIDVFNNTFINNRAGASGAVYVSVSDVVFRNNTFDSNTAVNGGVMYVNNSILSFENDQFTGNFAENNGGAFFVTDYEMSHLEFTAVSFSGNEAGSNAGVLEAGNAELTFNKCTATNNTCGWIGGVLNIYNHCVLRLNNSDFSSNFAPIFGGVMGSYESDIQIDRCTMSDNYAEVLGGAIHSDWSQLTINNSLFERDSSNETGGAFWLWHCDAYFDECEFNDNFALYNYGAIGSDSTTIHIDNSDFNNNTAVWGGALGTQRGALFLTDCSLTGNSGEHGGSATFGWSDVSMTNVDFSQNSGIWGGAIDLLNCNLDIDYCSFTENNAADVGGAIYYVVDTMDISLDSDLSFRMLGTDFISNSSVNGMSSIFVRQYNTDQLLKSVEVDECLFENNRSGTNGVFRIFGEVPDVKISNTIFKGNITAPNRSIFGVHYGTKGEVYNCLFTDNYPRGAIVHDRSDIAFTNCTFTGTTQSALDLRKGAIAKVTNSIFWNNGRTAVLTAGVGDGCQLTFNYCDVEFGRDSIAINDSLSLVNWGAGNITSNPKFIHPATGNFQLFYSSPCLEAGIMSIDVDGKTIIAPDIDIDGNPRPVPVGTNPDMGAYESPVPAGVKEDIIKYDQDILKQNIPNPFRNSTTLEWHQIKSEYIILDLINIQGVLVRNIVSEKLPAGTNSIELYKNDLSPGIYFYRLTTSSTVLTKSLQIVN